MTIETFFEKFDGLVDAPSAVAKVRELVLRLAFSGGLTGKSPIPNRLPVNWNKSTIDAISTSITPGFACAKSHQVEGGHVHLRTHNISIHGTLNFDLLVRIDPKMVDPDKASIQKGDVLFNNTNSQELVGKTSLVDRDYAYGFSNHITRIRFTDDVVPDYVVYYFTLLRNSGHFARLCNRWINQAGINTGVLKQQTIPYPPLAEQKRIVRKVDELMSMCDRLEQQLHDRSTQQAALASAALARFAEAPTLENLELLFHGSFNVEPAKLRKSILMLAVRGKLTQQDPNDEAADKLLGQLANQDRSRSLKKVSSLTSEDCPYDIPDAWHWARIGYLAAQIDYGTSEKAHDDASKVPVYRMGNIVSGRLIDRNLKYVNPTIEGLPGLYLKSGDLLFNRTNSYELVGKTAIFNGNDNTATFASYLIRIRLIPDHLFPAYFNLAMNAPYFRQTQIEPEITQQCGQANFNGTKLASTVVPVPPLNEQRRIVAKVNQLMATVDQLESQLVAACSTNAALLDAMIQELLEPKAEPVISMKRRRNIWADRAAIGCHVIRTMANSPYFGRTAAMKALFLSEAHLGLNQGGVYERGPAGPFDPWIYEFEEEGLRQGWFEVLKSDIGRGRIKVEYHPCDNLETMAIHAHLILTERQRRELDRILGMFMEMSTEEVEIVTTLYAAWNDFLIDGHTPTDQEIIREVRENWHRRKARFQASRLEEWLVQMRRKMLVPYGHPPRTQHLIQT